MSTVTVTTRNVRVFDVVFVVLSHTELSYLINIRQKGPSSQADYVAVLTNVTCITFVQSARGLVYCSVIAVKM